MKINTGVNLGGWISQYGEYDSKHFDTFIQEEDIKQIADWGIDHIRLPIDYPVIVDEKDFTYKEKGFEYIDRCIKWCQKVGLSIVLDLHQTPGYSFTSLESNNLFVNPEMQEEFIEIWKEFSRRYSSEGEDVIFELLNEIVEPDSSRWNKLAHETINAIRELDEDRVIIYGGNYYNSIFELENIQLVDDPNVVYTFHYYLPLLFTHQKASWSPITSDFDSVFKYPGEIPGLSEKVEEKPELYSYEKRYIGQEMNKELLRRELKPALDFIAETGREVYCGEFGVIERVDRESRLNWHRDFIELLNEYNIPRAVWTYKEMDFRLVDHDSNVVDEELVNIVSSS
ncbi:MAG: glycoside hydrolase family 5 protein [Bacillota bacterium]